MSNSVTIQDRLDEQTPLLTTPLAAAAPAPPVTADDVVHQDEAADHGGDGHHAKTPNMAIVFPAIASGIFLAAADSTIVLVNYATISSELNALNKAQWIVTTYTLAVACFQPLYGKLCDIFGRKNCLIAAYVLFAAGCLACGLSTTIEGLIAARVLQAVGGSGLGTIVSILLTDLVSLEDRGIWQGLLNIVYSMGAGFGAPLGGFLAGSVGWRWSFLGQVPLCAVALIIIVACLSNDVGVHDHSTHNHQITTGQRSSSLLENLRRIDFLGSITLIITIAALIFGLDRGSNISWTIPECYISFIAFFLAGAAFLYIETYLAAEPILPPSIIMDPGLFPVYLSASMAFFSIIALEFTLPLYYQARDQVTPQRAALYMIPAIVVGTNTALATGFWMRKTGKYFGAIMLAIFFQTLGGVVCYLFSGAVGTVTAALVVGHAISELGVGNSVVSCLIAVISNGNDNSVAIRTAAYYSFRNMGSVLGVSVVSTIIQQSLRDLLSVKLRSHGLDVDGIVDEVTKSLDSLKDLKPEIAQIVRDCYGQAMNRGFLVIMVTAALAILPALLIRGGREKREKKQTGPE